ncbi:MAG: hypothetical protein ACPGYV_05260 [Phycisphaeraceae bacterium]
MKTTRRLTTALVLAAAMLLHHSAPAQAPADLAPADTAVYIHIADAADWFVDLTDGPLGQMWRTAIEEAKGSGDLLAALGMDVDQFMDAYFGADVVMLSQGKDDDGNEKPGVLFTKVSAGDRAHAIDTLGLIRNGDIAGNPVYTGEDGNGVIVMMDQWVAMCDLDAVDYLRSILTRGEDTPGLADTEDYVKWTRELPEPRAMTMLAFESKASQHALGVVRDGKGMDATYLGTSPKYDEMMAMLGETTVAEFGPLPADTIAAATFNIEPDDRAKARMNKLDILLGGKSFVDAVLPKFDTPSVMFMGSVAGDAVTPALGVEMPVAGMAFKMNDASAADDMNQLFDNLVMMSNVAVMKYEAGLIPQREETYLGAAYKVAEIGVPVAQGTEFPELAPVQIVYGVVGDYYLVCSQETFFKQCVDADKADKTMRIDIEGKPHRLAQTPVLAMTARPEGFSSLVRSWVTMLDDKGLPKPIADRRDKPIDTEPLMDMVQLFQQYSLMKMQVWTGEDGLVIGRAQITAPQ